MKSFFAPMNNIVTYMSNILCKGMKPLGHLQFFLLLLLMKGINTFVANMRYLGEWAQGRILLQAIRNNADELTNFHYT